MLKIVTGHYHPDLEQALVDEVRSLKSSDPFAPLAIVVPSDPLKRRLQRVLCIEHRLALLDVHFLTFSQLAWHLFRERQALPPVAEAAGPFEEVSDLFLERLLIHIARRKPAGLKGLDLSSLPPGAWPALWTTLRDLRDAMVEPEAGLRAVAEGLFDPHETAGLQALLTLHALAREGTRALHVGTADDLAAMAHSWVAASPSLSRFRRICYYGFYDVTQVQLSLFEAIVNRCPVTLYFPLGDDPAFAFAERFFERHIEPLRGKEPVVTSPAVESGGLPQVRIMDAVGPDDELAVACKEVLALVDTHGYRFDEIGLVARTLEPYRAALRRTLDRHRIPFVTQEGLPVIQEPAAKVLAQLATLPQAQFYRAPVLDVLTSPFYRAGARRSDGVEPRPDLWRLAVCELGITRGEDEWRRLSSAGALEAWTTEGEAEEPDEWNGKVCINAGQVRLLGELVARLIQDCRVLPEQGGATELTDSFLALAEKHLAIPGLTADADEGGVASERVHGCGETIAAVLARLRQLDLLGETMTWAEWTALFLQALERTTIPLEPEDHAGVQVLDAMAARGLAFRALFVLGLNEKVFPRYIREDAFLRDRNRRVLDEALGYKTDEKLAGYDEERLLFALLRQAAGQRLYLLYQRADANGRPLAPSTYLDAFLKREDRDRTADLSVPRRLADRLKLPLFAPALLTREELAVGLVLQGRDPVAMLESADRGGALFERGLAALRVIESEARGLGEYDGMTGLLRQRWAALTSRGLAPTSLEQYAQCPFRYFSAKVLGLEPVRHEAAGDLSPPVLGELCHDTLQRCYRRLLEAGWPKTELPRDRIRADIASATDEAFADHAREHGAGYALIGLLARETVIALVEAMIESDERDFREQGFEPVGFEIEAEGSLEAIDPAAFKGLKIAGRLDRVDRRAHPPALRIVDYKYRHGDDRGVDRNLAVSAVRGYRLQPPLYALMAPAGPAAERAAAETVELAFLIRKPSPQVKRVRFDATEWNGPAGALMKKTVEAVVDGIREGRHLILPDGYCDRCEFSAACRRFHGPTWWRSYSSPPAKLLRRLRKQKVRSEE
jgi:ATP-dependent helicase/nuclease subunit B